MSAAPDVGLHPDDTAELAEVPQVPRDWPAADNGERLSGERSLPNPGERTNPLLLVAHSPRSAHTA